MAIAESIGTAIGEAVGRAYKYVSDLSVDSLLDLFNTDNVGGRQQELSYVDNINQSKKAHFENKMARRVTPVNESCLKYEKHLTVNDDGVTSADAARKAFIGEYNQFRDLGFHEGRIKQTYMSFQKAIQTNSSYVGTDKKIRSQSEMQDAKNELDNLIGRETDSLDCVDAVTCNTTVESEQISATLRKSKNLSKVMRARLIKAILADDIASRYAQNGSNDRIDMLRAQVEAPAAGGSLMNEVNFTSSDETPLIKERLATAMLTNQLYIELIFEEEKRVLLEALKLQLELEGKKA